MCPREDRWGPLGELKPARTLDSRHDQLHCWGIKRPLVLNFMDGVSNAWNGLTRATQRSTPFTSLLPQRSHIICLVKLSSILDGRPPNPPIASYSELYTTFAKYGSEPRLRLHASC
jgi:hypothetical protein